MAKINSNQITFVDLSDSRKLDVYISSNLPTTQIHDSNTGTYSPDWSSTNLELTSDVYLDSTKIIPETVKWYTKVGTVETPVGSNPTLIVSTNVLANNPILTYVCRVEYQTIQSLKEITFMRSDTGINGYNGKDGTGVNILGSYDTIAELQSAHPTGKAGDAYIVNGDLYVWTIGDSQWSNVGNIQGPAGKDGKDAKSIVLSGDSQVFKVNKNNVITPSTIKVTAQAFNTTVTNWTYSTNGGQTFLSTVPIGVSRNGDIVTITGSAITSNSIVIKASDGTIEDVFTVYKAIDGVDGSKGNDGAPAPIAFLTNENITFSANAQGQIATTTITSNVVAYNGTTKVAPTIGTITGAPTGMTITQSSVAASNEVMLTITIANNSTLGSASSKMGVISIPITSPVSTVLSLTWSKVNAGPTGSTGAAGADAYTVILTNESNTFAGDVSNAMAGSTTTQVLAYKGATAQTVTISSVNGKTAATTDTDTGIVGLKFKCSELSGTSPTITFTCTTAFVSASGSVPIVLSVGGVSFTKMFTYSIAFKGATGAIGPTGQSGSAGVPATSYWLISSANVVQKTSTGTIAVTPSTLTFVGKSQTGAATPTDYACRWIIEYSSDGTNYTNLYTSSANEDSKSITVSAAYKTIRARMYLAGGTATLLDEQIIPIVSDGAKGDKGDQGNEGVGIASTTITYGTSDSSSTQPTSWQNTIPTVAEGKYLWTRTVIDYTDTAREDTVSYTYAKQGSKGETGSAGSSVTVTSIQYQEGSSATTAPTGTWSNSVVSVADGKYLWTKIVFSDGKTSYAVAKQGSSGRGVSSIAEEYYQSTSATTQSGGSWSTTVPTWADGKYIWTRSVITYTDSTTYTTTPVCVTGQKGATGGTGSIGATGVGVSSVDVWYYQSTSATSLTGGTWATTAPTWADGKYIWTKTITTYTNSTTDETNAVCITGQKGSTGVGIKSVTEYYLATSSSSGVTSSTTGWTTAIQTITADNKYLWNYEIITYTDNTTSTTSPIIIGAFGNTGSTGATGKGIKSVTEYYLATALASGVTTATTGWTTTMQTLTTTKKYLWNYELITYTDNTTATINPVIIGVYGDKGAQGDKGNQGDRGAGISSVTVTYGVSADVSTQPTSWQTTLPTVDEGSYLWTRTVTDYTDASIADTVTLTYAKQGAKGSTGSAGTSVTVSKIEYQAGTSATTAPTGTWSNSVVTVAEGSYLWTKTTFSDGKVAYGVAKQGAKGSAGVNAITFQIYAPNGYLLSNEVESLTLQTFAYDGSTAITSATYAWSYQENDAWVAISNATTGSLTLTKDDVIKSKTYRCAMTYKNTTYYSTATVQDQSDIYDVMICVSDNINPLTGIYYWVVYALLYSEQGEADALLGPISINAPTSPTSGDYWYAVDTAAQAVTLKKYNGSAWVSSTDKQAYAYDWRHIIDGTQHQAIGNTDKVQIISCNSFTSSATFQCIVTDTDGSKLARCNIHLTDTSDPIVSATAPVGVKDGQLWMQTQTDGTFLLYIWDADTSTWKQLNADTKNVVHTTKPSSYKAGDLWVVESDTVISGYTKGTLLQSNATTSTFSAAHWTPSLKYENELSDVQNTLKSYKQYMNVDENGLHMQARDANGTLSPFQALFTNTRLSFYQDDLEVAYISDNKLNIYEANIDVLSVEKKIQLQKFEWAIESNESMSLIVNY